jgi:hypothetical protein
VAQQILRRLLHLDELAHRRHPLQVAEVGQEYRPVRARDDGAVRSGVAGQIADVDQVGDQHRPDAQLGQRVAQPAQPRGVVHVCSPAR